VSEALLVLNAGSSSLKFATFHWTRSGPEAQLRGQIDGLTERSRFLVRDASGAIIARRDFDRGLDHEAALRFLLDRLGSAAGGEEAKGTKLRLTAAGHRIVHGGRTFERAVRIDAGVLDALEALVPLAPLHQPHNLSAIRALRAITPDLPQVACFDTAFHRGQPPLAQAFALPRRYTDAGIQRYGFHGLSYEYVSAALCEVDPRAARGRTAIAHLGNGASLCALREGRSVASTMGFTPLDGVPMGTRCGALDPGVLLHLMEHQGLSAAQLEDLLYHQSGLLGVSGISSDVRELLASADPRAAEALELFVYRIGRELGSLAAALGGLDALVFTGGIGENAVSIRGDVCRAAAWLGVELDEGANAAGGPCISRAGGAVTAWVVPTDEERMIAHHVGDVLGLTAAERPALEV
jgi:acetate kinase